MLGERDLRAFCRPPMGVPVTFAGVSTYPDGEPVFGLFDRSQQFQLAEAGIGGAQVALPELRLPFNAFDPMPDVLDVVTVEGTEYSVNPSTAEDDGAFVCYQLKATR